MGASGACRCPNQRAIPTGRLIGHWTVVGWFEGPGDLRGSWSGPGRQLLPMQFVFLGGPGGTPGMCRLSWAAGCLAWENRRAAERAVSPRRLSGRMGCGYLSKTEPVLEIDPPRKRVVPRRWDRRADRYVRLGYVRGGESDDGDGGWNSNVSGGPQRHRWRTGMGCFLWQLKRRRFPNERPSLCTSVLDYSP